MSKGPFTFEEHVFPAEVEEIRQRLRPPDGKPPSDKPVPSASDNPRPSTAHALVGVSFSGGGIRSATFNLGVLQALHRHGLLPHVDYLSTVSGGGYLGGALSSMMHDKDTPFPFVREETTPEAPAMIHLRNNANYLAPDGGLDYATLAMVVGRGIVVNLLVLAPVLLFLAVIASLYAEWVLWDKAAAEFEGHTESLVWNLSTFYLTPRVALITAIWLGLSPAVTRLVSWNTNRRAVDGTIAYARRQRLYNSYSLMVGVLSLVAFVELQPVLVVGFHELFVPDSLIQRLFSMVGSGAASVAAGLYLQSRTLSTEENASGGGWRLVLVGLLGPMLPLVLYLYSADAILHHQPTRADFPLAWQASLPDSPLLRLAPELGAFVLALVLWLYVRVFVDVNEHSGHGFWRDRLSKAYLIQPGPGGGLEQNDALRLSALSQPGSRAPYHLVNTTVNLQGSPEESASGRSGDFYLFSKRFVGSPKLGFAPTEVVELVLPHVNLGTGVAISSAAAAPNMGTYTVTSLRMLLTLLNVRMNYWAPHPGRFSEHYGLPAARSQLATWLEAARSSPRFLGGLEAARWRPSLFELYRELFGQIDARGQLVNLSDGGHLENLGAYELLRRRCKYVIVCDGEADGAMRFGAMAALARFARVDLGVEIEIDLDGMRLQPNGYSQRSAAVGIVRYPRRGDLPAETGMILYMKASMTGMEHILLRQYRDAHPTFPHETTADQFFSEEQFEAYRALGYGIADGIFSEVMRRPRITNPNMVRAEALSFRDFVGLMDALRVQLYPTLPADVDAFVRLQSDLMQVDAAVGQAASEVFFDQYPELRGASSELVLGRLREDAAMQQRVLTSVNAQLQLMENVFLALNLTDPRRRDHEVNAGWMNLFRRWSASPVFRWGYALSAALYGSSFRLFCANALGLELTTEWRKVDYVGLEATGMLHPDDPARLREAVQGSASYELLVAVVRVAGEVHEPPATFGWVSLLEHADGMMRLGPHGLRPGADGLSAYTFLLRSLAAYVREGTAARAAADDLLAFGELDEQQVGPGKPVRMPVREELLARFGGQVDMEVLSDSVWGPAAVAADRPPDLTFANR